MNQTQNKNRKPHPEITLIGAAIVDVLAGPVSEKVFQTGSEPVDFMKFSFGGDALNEAVCLSRLGNQVELISQVGRDQTGINVLNFLKQNEVDISKISVEDGLQTGMNIVMVGEDAQRYFLTNPRSSLRTLSKEVILPQLDTAADIIGFASLFVSYRLDIAAMEELNHARPRNRRLGEELAGRDVAVVEHGTLPVDLAIARDGDVFGVEA